MDESLQIKDLAEFIRLRPDTHVGEINKQASLRAVVGWKADIERARAAADAFAYTCVEPDDVARALAKQVVVLKAAPAKRVATKATAAVDAEPLLIVGGAGGAEDSDADSGGDGAVADAPAAAASKPKAPRKVKDVACGAHLFIEVSPALEKIVDEVIQNALDRQHKDPLLSRIDITVDAAAGVITVKNDGSGMPVTKPERTSDKVPDEYWPTILYSREMAGGNFTKGANGHYAGGRNGLGGKVANALSLYLTLLVDDPINQMHFAQTWTKGMRETAGPRVASRKIKKGAVTVTFAPDMAFFGEPATGGFAPHVQLLIQSRAFEIAAQCRVPVYFNGTRVPVSSTAQLASLFSPLNTRCAQSQITTPDGARVLLDVSILPAGGDVKAGVLAFVNGVRCSRGTHVDACLRTLGTAMLAAVRTKTKRPDLRNVTPTQVREVTWMVLAVNLDEPAFTSQSKVELQTPESTWGFSWTPDAAFQARCVTLLADAVAEQLQIKDERKALAAANTATTGVSRRIVNLNKYEPAGMAGKPGNDATLVLTEGDSAMSLAMAGRAVKGSELLGVYCLRGKPLNPRGKKLAVYSANEVLGNVAKILGLKYGQTYVTEADARQLNYRFLEVFADQDHDGGHIVGLIVNWVQFCWPSLLVLRPDFIRRFASPVLIGRPKRGPSVKFLSVQAFRAWAAEFPDAVRTYAFQYFKGLGSHTASMGQEYFLNHEQYSVTLQYTPTPDATTLQHFFGQSDAFTNMRKTMIRAVAAEESVDYSQTAVPLTTFLQLEVLPYFREHVLRTLPWTDGLKRTQRKLLWAVRTFMAPGKVSKFTEMAMEAGKRAAYHHGEASLYGTLVAMAQSHAGTNNVNLFMTACIMGDRLTERDKHAAPRYLLTGLSPIVPFLVRKEDDPVLTYRIEDGDKQVEPVVLWPVVPLDLLNGAEGVATGWNTLIMPFHITDVVAACKGAASATPGWELVADAAMPWFDQLTGAVLSTDSAWVSTGLYVVSRPDAATVVVNILDLPYGAWAHKHDADKLARYIARPDNPKGFIKRKDSDTTDTRICYTLTCNADAMNDVLGADWCVADGELRLSPRVFEGWNSADTSILEQARRALADGPLPRYPKLEKALGLVDTFDKGRMHRLNARGQVCDFPTMSSVVRDFAAGRLALYADRKAYQMREYARRRTELENRLRFITAINARDMNPIAYANTRDWWRDLASRGFASDAAMRVEAPKVHVEDGMDGLVRMPVVEDDDADDDEAGEDGVIADNKYTYLTNMRATQWTRAGVVALQAALDDVNARAADIARQEPRDMWLRELDELLVAYDAFFKERQESIRVKTQATATKTKSKARAVKPKAPGSAAPRKRKATAE